MHTAIWATSGSMRSRKEKLETLKKAAEQAEADEEMQKLGVKENEHSVIKLRKSS